MKKKWKMSCLSLLIAFSLGGCGYVVPMFGSVNQALNTPEPTVVPELPDAVKEVVGDEDVLSSPTSEEALFDYIADYNTYNEYDDHYPDVDGLVEESVAVGEEAPLSDGASSDASSSTSSETVTSSDSHSTTNNQVTTVDEGDIIKTDGNYIYRVTWEGSVSVIDPVEMTVIDKVSIEADADEVYIEDIFVHEGILVVLYTYYSYDNDYHYIATDFTGMNIYEMNESNEMELVKEYHTSGYYTNSRLSDGHVYVVSHMNLHYYTHEEYNSFSPDSVMPIFGEDGTSTTLPLEDICIIPTDYPHNYTIVTALDLGDMELVKSRALLGGGEELYMSQDTMYLTGQQFYNDTVTITKLSIDGTSITPVANGSVDGYIESQFSMDEHNGYFRIATTSWGEYDSINNVYVLDENLEIVGNVEGLAPGERIYSVRFMGDMGYMVTFRETDPLFAIDLSDPYNPEVLGELKIPGFSEYMHPIDEDTLVGIGVNTIIDDYGSVIEDGLKLSLFDVSDPTNPIERNNFILGELSSHSQALYDHKAVYYNEEKMLLGFPAELYGVTEVSEDDGFYVEHALTFSGYMLVNVDKEDGFSIAETLDALSFTPDRALHIGDYFYTSSGGDLQKYDFDTFELVDSITF